MTQKPHDIGLPMERRKRRRSGSSLSGLMVHGPRDAALDCDIIDLDAKGARVRLRPAPAVLPTDFRLLLPGSAVVYDARLAWRRGATCGLAFDQRHDLTADCPPAVAALRSLCPNAAAV
jgi:hypothetical protein